MDRTSIWIDMIYELEGSYTLYYSTITLHAKTLLH